MRKAILILLLSGPLWAAEPVAPVKAPVADVIVLPVIDPPPAPTPPVPSAVTKLSADVFYIVSSNSPFIVLSSPAGIVTVTQDTGPLRIRGRFVENPGVVQTKDFPAKFLTSVNAVATGKCELLILPSGATGEGQIIRRCLDVTVGPAPPPGPGPGPNPPIPGTFDRTVWDAYQADPDPAKVAHAAWAASVYKAAPDALADPAVTNYGQLLTKLTNALHSPTSGMPAGSIKTVLAVIAADETTTFGTVGSAPIDKAKAAAAFAKYATALSNLK